MVSPNIRHKREMKNQAGSKVRKRKTLAARGRASVQRGWDIEAEKMHASRRAATRPPSAEDHPRASLHQEEDFTISLDVSEAARASEAVVPRDQTPEVEGKGLEDPVPKEKGRDEPDPGNQENVGAAPEGQEKGKSAQDQNKAPQEASSIHSPAEFERPQSLDAELRGRRDEVLALTPEKGETLEGPGAKNAGGEEESRKGRRPPQDQEGTDSRSHRGRSSQRDDRKGRSEDRRQGGDRHHASSRRSREDRREEEDRQRRGREKARWAQQTALEITARKERDRSRLPPSQPGSPPRGTLGLLPQVRPPSGERDLPRGEESGYSFARKSPSRGRSGARDRGEMKADPSPRGRSVEGRRTNQNRRGTGRRRWSQHRPRRVPCGRPVCPRMVEEGQICPCEEMRRVAEDLARSYPVERPSEAPPFLPGAADWGAPQSHLEWEWRLRQQREWAQHQTWREREAREGVQRTQPRRSQTNLPVALPREGDERELPRIRRERYLQQQRELLDAYSHGRSEGQERAGPEYPPEDYPDSPDEEVELYGHRFVLSRDQRLPEEPPHLIHSIPMPPRDREAEERAMWEERERNLRAEQDPYDFPRELRRESPPQGFGPEARQGSTSRQQDRGYVAYGARQQAPDPPSRVCRGQAGRGR